MVNHLLSLITPAPKPAASPSSPPDDRKKAQLSSIRGSLTTIGKLLNPPFHRALAPAGTINPLPSTIRHRSTLTLTPTSATHSPLRTRKNHAQSAVCGPSSNETPRIGEKAKQRRVDNTNTSLLSNYDQSAHNQIVNQWNHYNSTSFGFHGKPTTELLGWRRLFPEEIVRMEEGTFFLLCIPPSSWRNDSEVTVMRNAFFDRLINAVILSKQKEFPNNGKSKKIKAHDYLNEHHSVICPGGVLYIQVACVLRYYPHRDEYIRMNCSMEDVSMHIQRGAGLNITLLDFQTPSQRQPDSSILIKWKEVTTVELYVEYRRGDPRPKIELSVRNQVHLYADELVGLIELVKNDDRLTLELAYAFMVQKNRIMAKQLSKALVPDSSPEPSMLDTYVIALRSEVDQSKLQNFARRVDLQFQDSWRRHYLGFHPFDRFQVPELAEDIYDQIQDLFPLHFHVIRSLMFGMRSHQPSMQNRVDYSDRKRKLTNYFFSMIRVRDPASLVHWAMVGTMAMITSGGKFQHFRNPITSTFSAGKKATLLYLDALFQSTRPARLKLLRIQPYLHSSYDNYNCQHPVTNHDQKGIQEKYKSFCLELEKSRCAKSRMCAIFMKVIQHWLICEDAISIGDWAVLEVLGCDWIDFWASTGKHLYLLESKRRMEALYNLNWMDLEYHRMGRLVRMNEGQKLRTMDHLCETTLIFISYCSSFIGLGPHPQE